MSARPLRVCIFGPESTGKTELAERLAAHFGVPWSPESARLYADEHGPDLGPEDTEPIGRGQVELEERAIAEADRLVIHDTDLLSTCLWSEALYGRIPTWVREEAARRTSDLYLVMDIDVPRVDDPQRDWPFSREAFMARCLAVLREHGCRHIVISGDWEERFRRACAAIERLLERPVEEEFDRWAERGQGESMAEGHLSATQQALDRVSFGPEDRCLDIGCGVAWASRLMRRRGAGHVVGIDLVERMIRRAPPMAGVDLLRGSLTDLPFRDGAFTRTLSVEQIYYVPDLDRGLRELRRVLAPGGKAIFMLDLYAENPVAPIWQRELPMRVHCLTGDQWCARLRAAGFSSAEHFRARDTRPLTLREAHVGDQWEPTYEDYLAFREAGSLILLAQ